MTISMTSTVTICILFDKHDVTAKKFDAIVEKAGKVDANYAAQIEGSAACLENTGKNLRLYVPCCSRKN